MDRGTTTSFRLPDQQLEFMTREARCRDISCSQLLRRLIAEAMTAVVAGTGPTCWPNYVEPPSRTRLPAVRPPDRRGHRRNTKGQFTS